MNLDHPLSEEELDELDQFLISDATPEESMDISMLDGFLTALAIGPSTHLPSQWLPKIWGETEGNPMVFKDQNQFERIYGLVMRMYNDRIHDLHEDIDEYVPLLFEQEQDGKTIPIIDEWCIGFIQGIHLDLEGWQALIGSEDETSTALLTPMMLYGTEDGWDELQTNQALQDQHQELADAIGPCVIGIRDFWLPYRKTASTFRRDDDKVGRNDPCPCGSGKKFKKCCGDQGSLH